VLSTDTVTLALDGTWQQASEAVTAPPGTAFVDVTFSHPSGGPGDTVFLDDIVIEAPPDVLDADTATIEGSAGQWVGWFSATPSRSTDQAHGGAASLSVDIAAPFGWGIQLANYPGFATGAGPKNVGFWARAGSGTGLGATMTLYWRDASNAVLATDTVTLPALDSTWQQAAATATAPAGTVAVDITFSHPSGVAGDSLYLDDISIVDG